MGKIKQAFDGAAEMAASSTQSDRHAELTPYSSSLVNNQSSSSALSLPCLRFSLTEIKRATNYFTSSNYDLMDHAFIYHGNISGNGYSGEVLIKKFYRWRDNLTLMFKNEIKVLLALNHVNIISLLGICDEGGEKILVYEFMPNGSLYDYLYRHTTPSHCLTVEQRLEICLGVGKGLCYLHSGLDINIIHGEINTNNIFLDASLVPKISGFRYAMTHAAGWSSSQEITTIRLQGENAYAPPEFHELGYKGSQKEDIYAFGIVLLELLCERKPLDRLLELALPFMMKGELPKATPEHVKKNITLACTRQCEKLILNCLEFEPDKRPCMDQVVQDLELALKLQKDQGINFKEQSSDVNNRCKNFSLVEIKRATNELSNIIGEGAFGKVYNGKISDNGNNIDVAVKFMSTDLERGIPAFEIEKKLLLACDHVNIISLLGYCDEKDAKILVYEFMPNGSLFDYLYKPKYDTPRLIVEQRLEICLGVAKGLCYLHSRDDYNIIHSDLKTDNILLDGNLVPKISDFGLSRARAVGPSASSQVTTHIQGTQGYIAPECYEPNYKLSRKADVYAFGVVLLEVLCEKPAWERLVMWALQFILKGELPKFTPKDVVKNMSPECLRACVNLIRDCLDNNPNNRPFMSHVLTNLDLALTLHKMNAHGNNQKNKSQAKHQQTFSFSDINEETNVVVKQMDWSDGSFSDFDTIENDEALRMWVYDNYGFIESMANGTENEINMLSECHHANIVSLLEYWGGLSYKTLIYEYMPNGSLYHHLHSKQDGAIHLIVEQRLEICLGVAKGLSYLHSSNIIHGNLNSKRILLDHNFVAKITGFEFSRKCVAEESTSQQSTSKCPGNMHGYLAPECHTDNYKASKEADVYAFGVLILEVLCERRANSNLITSALQFIMREELAKFTPKHVGPYISRKSEQACESLLRDCLDSDPGNRHFINQVVEKLEVALKLQQEQY